MALVGGLRSKGPCSRRPLLDASNAALAGRPAQGGNGSSNTGLRVLALAQRRLAAASYALGAVDENLPLVGLVGISDLPRPEAVYATTECQDSAITPVMVTSDDRVRPGRPRAQAARGRSVEVAQCCGRSDGHRRRAMVAAEPTSANR